MMLGKWWIEMPQNSSFETFDSQWIFDSKSLFTIISIIRPEDVGFSSPSNEPFNSHNAEIHVHRSHNLNVQGSRCQAREKETPKLFT